LECSQLNATQPNGAKSVEKLRKYYQKTQKKSEKIEFLRENSPLFAGVQGFTLSQNDLAGLHFLSKEVI